MIGEKLRRLIKRKGIKQVDVCRAVGLSPSRLSNYLSGSREPDLETLSKIARFLEVKLDYFAYGDTIKNNREIGERIKKVREMRGLSKKDLSDTTGYNMTFLAGIELGQGEFERETIDTIAEVLKYDADELLGKGENISTEPQPMVAERDNVDYLPGSPQAQHHLEDVAAGRTDILKTPFWVVVGDGRFAPKVHEGELLFIEKLVTLPSNRDSVVYVSGGTVRYMRCFENEDSILLTPETNTGEPVTVQKASGYAPGTQCYRVHWHARRPE
ncbi:helix-turn-helix transcriptional regulator [Limisalsivibrio acetivorans]|uniref:helix-turn-helix transcriptional regulator n=1 Tax=Limisalsivibrio acetivorans TaxID=1304888 RepID=UPI0003B5BACA|nr:helix-turn-helix transcriptional regulator [Limisalsivibrio acetivorans]